MITKYGEKTFHHKDTRNNRKMFRKIFILTLNIRDDENKQSNTMEDIWEKNLRVYQ